jgi:hypothetical protein
MDPSWWDAPPCYRNHHASLPMMASVCSLSSDMSGPIQDILRHLELQQYKEWLKALLESKLDYFCKEVWVLWLEDGANGGMGLALMNVAINKVMSLFCTQLRESVAWGLDDSQMDTRGKLNIQLVKDIVKKTHVEARAMI